MFMRSAEWSYGKTGKILVLMSKNQKQFRPSRILDIPVHQCHPVHVYILVYTIHNKNYIYTIIIHNTTTTLSIILTIQPYR